MQNTITIGRTTYKLTKLPEPKPFSYAYSLKGPRGAEYLLMRNGPNPTMLFATNARKFTASTPFDGEWFRDGGPENPGTLRLSR